MPETKLCPFISANAEKNCLRDKCKIYNAKTDECALNRNNLAQTIHNLSTELKQFTQLLSSRLK